MNDFLENYDFFFPDDLLALNPLTKKDHANIKDKDNDKTNN